jgi:hypothetical protein
MRKERIMRDTSESAFPQIPVDFGKGPADPEVYGMGGMSLRDWFAGHALAGLMVSSTDKRPDAIAWIAYQYANAMLAERAT